MCIRDRDTVNLFSLGFSQDTLDLSGRVRLEARSLKPGALDAALRLQQFHAHTPQMDFPVYEASVVALSANGVDSLVLKSPFAEAEVVGDFDYQELPEAMRKGWVPCEPLREIPAQWALRKEEDNNYRPWNDQA